MNKIALIFLLVSSFSFSAAFAFGNENAGISFDNRLIDAVEDDNYEIVKAIILQGEDTNQTGKFETSAIHRAAFNGNDKMLDLLIKNGADVNIRDFGGATPLHFAARQGRLEASKTLITKGADINAQDDLGYTPLHRAIVNNQSSESLFLISSGANINTVNNEGNTPLIDAVKISNPTLVKQLIIRGADRTVHNNKGLDAIDYAIKLSNSSIDKILAKSKEELTNDENIGSQYSVVVANINAPIPDFLKKEAEIQNQIASATPYTKTTNIGTIQSIKLPVEKVEEENINQQNNEKSENTKMLQAQPAPVIDVKNAEEASGLVRAPRLADDGKLPDQLNNDYKKVEQAEKTQTEKIVITKTEKIPVSRLPWAEAPSDAIYISDINPAAQAITSITKIVENSSVPKLPEIKYDYAQNNINDQTSPKILSDAGYPASMNRKYGNTVSNSNPKATTVPVQNMQIISTSEKNSIPQPTEILPKSQSQTSPQIVKPSQIQSQQQIDYSYAKQVDDLMNDTISNSVIDENYEAEVDSLMNQAVSQISVITPAVQQTKVPQALPASMRKDNNFSDNVNSYVQTQLTPNNYTEQPIYTATKETVLPKIVKENEFDASDGYNKKPAGVDYKIFKPSLIENIQKFYNSGSSPSYTNYDMSNLESQRISTLGIGGASALNKSSAAPLSLYKDNGVSQKTQEINEPSATLDSVGKKTDTDKVETEDIKPLEPVVEDSTEVEVSVEKESANKPEKPIENQSSKSDTQILELQKQIPDEHDTGINNFLPKQ